MLKSKVVAGAGVAAALAFAVDAAHAQSNPQFGLAGVALEGVILQRHDIGNALMTVPDGGSDPYFKVSFSDLDPSTAGGLRLQLDGWLFGQRTVYSVLGAWGFDSSLLRTGMDPSSGGGTDAAYVPSSTVNTSNSNELDTLQAKFRSSLFSTDSAAYFFGGAPDRPGFNFIAGGRTIIVEERLRTAAYDSYSDYDPGGDDVDRVKLDVSNWATGLQIGIEGYTYIAPGFKLGGFVKGGLLANFVDVKSRFSSDDDADNRLRKSHDSTEFAQFVELSARVSYEIAPNMELTASGMMLYVNGIAEAGSHFSGVADADARRIDADSDALFYGGTVGLTYRFN
jgi:hypothetical protein